MTNWTYASLVKHRGIDPSILLHRVRLIQEYSSFQLASESSKLSITTIKAGVVDLEKRAGITIVQRGRLHHMLPRLTKDGILLLETMEKYIASD